MFEAFELSEFVLPGSTIRFRRGGAGPPLLLLHGHPRTHTTWHQVAPLLAREFTVVCPDLPGFGQSRRPVDPPFYAASSKRAKALDCLALMRALGHETFNLAGHDRGSYTAFRLAMDHPRAVRRLVLLDCVPILEAFERCNARFAHLWWHWFFYLQQDKAEQAINADPARWYGGNPDQLGAENFEDYNLAIHDPRTVATMLADYRAGFHVDMYHDLEDRRRGRKLECPVHLLWSLQDDLQHIYRDVISVWKPWVAGPLTGRGLDCGHHMAEEIPRELAGELRNFFH